MARPATIRGSYSKDVTILSRLTEAVERDTKRGKAFQDKVTSLLRELIFELTRVSGPNSKSGPTAKL